MLFAVASTSFAQSNQVEELAYPDSSVEPSAAWSEDAAAAPAEPEVPMEQLSDAWCPCDGNSDCQCQCGGDGGFCCLGDLIQQSDHCYDSFISPMTNPVFFEDPRNLTEARLIFLNHKVPLSAMGGDIQLYALQVRAALTDRLSLIATKDGYIVSDNPLIDDGWADVSAGLKYLLYSDPANQVLASAGAVYEMPVGAHRAAQGLGDGTFDLFLTGGAQLCDCGHWIGAGGFVLPTDDNSNSTWCYVSNHFDYEFYNRLYSLIEINWYHWLESGDNGIPGVEGGDLFNFGSTGVAGNNIVTGAFGVKYKPTRNQEIGVCWELPLTERRDVLENRLTFDWILRY
ncbi:MAG: hypothetical protein AB7G28_23065 [Pirellulales bacterium]